jgi:hypothetical protein
VRTHLRPHRAGEKHNIAQDSRFNCHAASCLLSSNISNTFARMLTDAERFDSKA